MIEKIINSNEAGQRFDKFLKKFMPNATTSFFYKMLRKKNITLNGKKAEGNEILALNDSIKFFFSDETFNKFRFGENNSISSIQTSLLIEKDIDVERTSNKGNSQSFNLVKKAIIDTSQYEKAYKQFKIRVVFENKHILIANKPSGVLSQKSDNKELSLNEWLIGYLLALKQLTSTDLETFKPSICNRLDRNTSGLIICSKSLAGSQKMAEIIKNRSLKKYYLAIARGKTPAYRHLSGYIIKNNKKNKVTVSDKPINDGQKIETAFKTLFFNKEKNQSLIEVDLITGKTHQIRAHMASIGFPLVGDIKYGKSSDKGDGQLLHAYKVIFPEFYDGIFDDISNKEIVNYPKWDIENTKDFLSPQMGFTRY